MRADEDSDALVDGPNVEVSANQRNDIADSAVVQTPNSESNWQRWLNDLRALSWTSLQCKYVLNNRSNIPHGSYATHGRAGIRVYVHRRRDDLLDRRILDVPRTDAGLWKV